jgi:hypothetical protein
LTAPNATQDDVRRILNTARTVVVIGAHPKPEKPAHFVPAYLLEQGYRVLPVNARRAGEAFFGERAPGAFTAANTVGESVDVVCIFRRSDAVPEHLGEIQAMQPLPKVVWLQKGIRNEAFAETLRARGVELVQDKCMLEEHKELGITPLNG